MQVIKPSRALELVTMDLTGKLPKTKAGNLYILVICDHFTKWVSLYALATHTADKVAECLLDFFSTFGIAENILTDQGAYFQSQLIAELMDLLDTHRLRTSPYHPQTDGITERLNRTLKTMITHFANEEQSNWDEI